MTTTRELNLELGRRINELTNARDPGVWSLFAPGFVQRSGAQSTGVEEARIGDERLFAAIPDAVRTIDGELADDTTLVQHWHFDGTVRATGNRIRWEGCTWMRIENGLVAEGWTFWDPTQLQPRRAS